MIKKATSRLLPLILALTAGLPLAHAGFSGPVPTAEELFLRGKFAVTPKWYVPFQRDHRGEEIDLSTKRPAIDLEGTIFQQKYGRQGSHVIGNFYHAGEFYIVRLGDQAVKSVYFQMSYFPPVIMGQYVAAHTLLRFELDPQSPVELVAKMPTEAALNSLRQLTPEQALAKLPEELGGNSNRLLNVVISSEATATKSEDPAYDLIRGQRGDYLLVDRFVSMEVRLEDLFGETHPVTQYQVEMSAEKAATLLRTALTTSQSDALTKLYITLSQNCTTRAFDILETATGPDPRFGMLRRSIERRVPPVAPGKVHAMGGLTGFPLMDEVESPGLAPEVALAKQRLSRRCEACFPK